MLKKKSKTNLDRCAMVVEWRTSKVGRHYKCKFICIDCSIEVEAYEDNVKSGKSTRCIMCRGRIMGDANITHNKSKHKLYSKWNDIKRRCYDKTRKDYKRYGGKGVIMCDEWKNDFESFYNWCINNGYKEGLALDKDYLCEKNNISPKVYSPETCMFVTLKENNSFKRLDYDR